MVQLLRPVAQGPPVWNCQGRQFFMIIRAGATVRPVVAVIAGAQKIPTGDGNEVIAGPSHKDVGCPTFSTDAGGLVGTEHRPASGCGWNEGRSMKQGGE